LSGIFITYRREDTQGFAGRLDDDLSERFGDTLIFRDREIQAGDDFVVRLRETLDAADVALAVIGPRWTDARDRDGQRRLDRADDWVRLELETLLGRGIPIVPVLVGGARMPGSHELPDSLEALARRQAFPLSDLRWHVEVNELATRLAALSPTLDRAFRARGGTRPSGDGTLAIRQIADRVFDEAVRSRGPAPAAGPALSPRVARWISRRAKRLLTTAAGLAIAYLLIREFGGPEINTLLDRFLARLDEAARSLRAALPGQG
jgi:hypothetical protein